MAEGKTPIPIYDDTAPIACTITNTEVPERVDIVERMRSAVTAIERTPTGLLLRFPDTPDVRTDLATFVVDEKRCCQFWGFDVIDSVDSVALRWDGPPAVDRLLDELQTFFTSDAPVSTLEGLL
jgi:hypothetical protein